MLTVTDFGVIRYALIALIFTLMYDGITTETLETTVSAWIPITNKRSLPVRRSVTENVGVACNRNNPIHYLQSSLKDDDDIATTSSRTNNISSSPTITKSRRSFMIESAATVTAVATTRPFVSNADPTIEEIAPLSSVSSVSSSLSIPSSAITLPKMGLGAWAWGDSFFWGYDKKNDDELRKVFDYSVQNNPVTLFDTAEVYGFGRSESLIGEFSKSYPNEKIQVATKFAALPWRTKPIDVVNACKKSLERLDGRAIDLYQIHFPGAWSNEEYWDGIAMSYEMGLIKAVGVSNYGVDAVTACHDALAKRGIPLTSNQIQLSLLYPHPLYNGLMEKCKELNVNVLSYSPLALGMLTGKYTPDNKPNGPRKSIYDKLMTTPDYMNLLSVMDEIAKAHSNTDRTATIAQVALNWTRTKGSIPIPGARTVNQVQGNYNALQWDLTNEEVQLLDTAAAKVTTFIKPDQGAFPKKDKNTGLIMFDS